MNDQIKTSNSIPNAATSPFSALQSAFENQELKARDRHYNVDDGEALIAKLKAALSQSETGARLVQMADQNKIKIRLLKSKHLQSAATEQREVFLAAEAGQTDPQMHQLLEFGGVLREAEQILMGFSVPVKGEDELEKASRIHSKYLDKIVHMCKIGLELEIFYGERVLSAIRQFGYEDMYNAHKNSLGHQEVEKIYRNDQDRKTKK